MKPSLLDTSSLSDILRPAAKRLPRVAQRIRKYLRAHRHFTFSQISYFKVLRGLRAKQATTQIEAFLRFCQGANLVPVELEILDLAADYWAVSRRKGIVVEDGDYIIAASAKLLGYTLVTANPKHFAWNADLEIENWRE